MKYSKPEVVVVSRAVDAIEHMAPKPSSPAFDSAADAYIDSVNAYEADE